MKKLFAFVLAFSMLFALVGCGGQEKVTPRKPKTEAPKTVTLADAAANTAEELEQANNLTLKLEANVESTSSTGGLASGINTTVTADIKAQWDLDAEEISIYGQINASGMDMPIVIHDGYLVSYDFESKTYYKEDISAVLDEIFAQKDTPAANMDLDDLIDELPEDVLIEIESIFDLDTLVELAEKLVEEKLSDEQWVNDVFGYSTSTKGSTVTHSYHPDVVELLKAIISHFEEAFLNADDYDDLMDSMDDFTEEIGQLDISLDLIQADDKLTGFGMNIGLNDLNGENVKLDCTFELADIGTTEIDLDQLQQILDEADTSNETSEPASIIGVIDGQSYKNTMMGIACTLDDQWTMATHEEAAELMGTTAEIMDLEKQFEQAGTFCDFYASYSDMMSSVNIMIQKETAVTQAYSDEDFIQIAMQSVPTALEAAGFSNIKITDGTIEFAGETRYCIFISSEISGIQVYQTQVLIRNSEYNMTITASSFVDDLTKEFLANFVALEEEI